MTEHLNRLKAERYGEQPPQEREEEVAAHEVLDSFGLHSYYSPTDEPDRKIHDRDCRFCEFEDKVIEAMELYLTMNNKQHPTPTETGNDFQGMEI